MSGEQPFSLAEAIAVIDTYRHVGYKNRALLTVLHRANKIIAAEAKRVVEQQTDGMCTSCWGDGFHRTAPNILSGPCHECDGTGKRGAANTSASHRDDGSSAQTVVSSNPPSGGKS